MNLPNINIDCKSITDMIKTLANLNGMEILRLGVLFIIFSIGVEIMIHGINFVSNKQCDCQMKESVESLKAKE